VKVLEAEALDKLRLNHLQSPIYLRRKRHRLRSITPCERLLLIAGHDKPAWIFADYHFVQVAGDLQFMLVAQNGLNAAASSCSLRSTIELPLFTVFPPKFITRLKEPPSPRR
jgi:hypothetical protein